MKLLTFAFTASFFFTSLHAAEKPINTPVERTPCQRAQLAAIEQIKDQFGVKAICACKEKEDIPVLQCKADKGAVI